MKQPLRVAAMAIMHRMDASIITTHKWFAIPTPTATSKQSGWS